MNLQDLPPEILQIIFSYCKNCDRTLFNLSECSLFLKKFIEDSPSLMKDVHLDLVLHHGDENINSAITACLKSTRKYSAISISLGKECVESDVPMEVSDGGEAQKQKTDTKISYEDVIRNILHKSCSTIKHFAIGYWITSACVIELLKCLNEMEHVEGITLRLESSRREETTDSPDIENQVAAFSNSFPNLKLLDLTTSFPSIFNLFKRSRSIRFLFMAFSKFEVDFTDLSPFRGSLRHLRIFVDYRSMNLSEMSQLLIGLKNSNLDLRHFELIVNDRFKHDNNTNYLMEFLISQRNLEKFEFMGNADSCFMDAFMRRFNDLQSLLEVSIEFENNFRYSCQIERN